MSDVQIKENEFSTPEVKTFYLSAGPKAGPLLIFIHGWPGIAETWKPQLTAFAAHGFHVVAPDMRGYGRSTATHVASDYRLERVVADMLALLAHLEKREAIWVGHDWGAAAVWALVAHHPQVCTGVINLSVPYRTLEYGLEALISTVNREIYPFDKFPNGQWDYQVYYESSSENSNRVFEADIENSVKVIFRRGASSTYGKPAPTSSCTRDGGWFGGAEKAPDMGAVSQSVLDQETFELLCTYLKKNGFFGVSAWYLNHAANVAYTKTVVNEGVLELPVLFIGGKYDAVCGTERDLSSITDPMRKYCLKLTETSVDGGHWIGLELPNEVNTAIEGWLRIALPESWPK